MFNLIKILLFVFYFIGSSAMGDELHEPEVNNTLPKNVMIVLDASKGMAEKKLNYPKIDVAKDVIHDLMSNWDKEVPVGLLAYGNSATNDCQDIQVIVPTSKFNAYEISKRLAKIEPKGQAPLTAALRKAAEQLRYRDKNATIILITSGQDSCKADPCLLAKEMEESGSDLTVYVIGFGVKSSEEEGLRCLAENTGGLYYAANDRESLQEVLQFVVDDISATDSTPNLYLRAHLAVSNKEISDGIKWRIESPRANLEGEHKVLEYSSIAHPSFRLSPGNYLLKAEYGTTTLVQAIHVNIHSVNRYDFEMDAAIARFGAKTDKKSPLIESGLRFVVTSPDKRIEGNYEVIASSSKPAPVFYLKPGDYRLVIKYGGIKKVILFRLLAGEEVEQVIDLNSGVLQLTSVISKGMLPLTNNLRWWVSPYNPKTKKVGEVLHYSHQSNITLPLSEGSYVVNARYGYAESQHIVQVTPGKVINEIINFHAGVVQFNLNTHTKKRTRWWVKQFDQRTQQVKIIAFSLKEKPQFILPAGKYQIEAVQNNKKIKKEIVVKEGQRQEFAWKMI